VSDIQKALEEAAHAVDQASVAYSKENEELGLSRWDVPSEITARAAVVAFLRAMPQFQGEPGWSLEWLPFRILAAIEKEPQG
jgi:hypothetical protein